MRSLFIGYWLVVGVWYAVALCIFPEPHFLLTFTIIYTYYYYTSTIIFHSFFIPFNMDFFPIEPWNQIVLKTGTFLVSTGLIKCKNKLKFSLLTLFLHSPLPTQVIIFASCLIVWSQELYYLFCWREKLNILCYKCWTLHKTHSNVTNDNSATAYTVFVLCSKHTNAWLVG